MTMAMYEQPPIPSYQTGYKCKEEAKKSRNTPGAIMNIRRIAPAIVIQGTSTIKTRGNAHSKEGCTRFYTNKSTHSTWLNATVTCNIELCLGLASAQR